tara:strand:+ start:31 stop:456 length:426 start_codon:yes stop_codon:yes gene_type:complete
MNTFFLIFIGLPALEIFLMIKIGVKIGAIYTIALIFLTAFIGIYYARIQGIQTFRSGILSLYRNEAPIYEILSGASIALASLLLIIPGFLTDIFGFILLIPLTRRFLFRNFFKNKNIKSNDNKKNRKIIDGEIINKDKDEV